MKTRKKKSTVEVRKSDKMAAGKPPSSAAKTIIKVTQVNKSKGSNPANIRIIPMNLSIYQ